MTATRVTQERIVDKQAADNISRVEELAYELRIEETMTRQVKTLTPEKTMQEALDLFRQSRISGAPVVVNEELVGILSIEDLIHCLVKTDLNAKVNTYMTPNPITVKGTDLVVEALKRFVNTHFGRLPVVNQDNRLIGIITKGDISRGLLKALQRETLEEEIRRYRASHLFDDIESDRSSLILRYDIKPRDFTKGGSASSNIKRALLRLGATPQIARRCGIAIYEAEMNLIIHATNGGVIRVEIEPHEITILAYDDGPGIKNVDLALKPGWSTASEEIREMGFGAGMGLVNIARCTDNMELDSVWGKGTRVKMKINFRDDETVGEGSH